LIPAKLDYYRVRSLALLAPGIRRVARLFPRLIVPRADTAHWAAKLPAWTKALPGVPAIWAARPASGYRRRTTIRAALGNHARPTTLSAVVILFVAVGGGLLAGVLAAALWRAGALRPSGDGNVKRMAPFERALQAPGTAALQDRSAPATQELPGLAPNSMPMNLPEISAPMVVQPPARREVRPSISPSMTKRAGEKPPSNERAVPTSQASPRTSQEPDASDIIDWLTNKTEPSRQP
jgi:hypothetical protein